MTTIDTIEDLLRLVRENEEVRAALRREVLTEELLALPAQFIAMRETQASMQQTQNAILETQASMQESLVALQESFVAMQESLVALQESFVAMQETQNSMLEELRETRRDISALHGMYRQQHEDFGRFRGSYAADAARRNRGEIALIFARLRSMRNLRVRALDSDERSDMLDEHYDAVTALNLRDRAWQTFDVPDLIVEVTARRSSAPGFYIAIEASYTGDMEDLLRATDHAKILRSATGLDAYPIVAGVRIGSSIRDKVFEDVTHFIRINDEDTALWYQISEAHMEPPDPI